MPNKHVSARNALIGVGGQILRLLLRPRTVSALWEEARESNVVASFNQFVLALDLLYAMGVIRLRGDVLVRSVAE